MKIYKPTSIAAKPWDDIEQYYSDRCKRGLTDKKMLELVMHIISTGLSSRLYAYSSFHGECLNVSIADPVQFHVEFLVVRFNRIEQKWRFEYYAKPNENVEFERTYPADKGIEKFDNFIKMIRW